MGASQIHAVAGIERNLPRDALHDRAQATGCPIRPGHRNLMGLTDKMELYPRLAECIEQIEPTAWNVVLKAGIKFHVFAIGVALFWYAQAQVRWFMHDLA
ncbi:hypothetical protein F3P66_23995 [Agrobacterium fabrum]|uniref:hypothetical protein n=1 Tax=Agrobacterium fabrum TaxID=1176649 RepID=UPI00193D06B4|nr:hypothetical protein [Agrobacterium fabrum]QRM62363.1 hypothetical protein F3P66_23995 [Agrobacterium fabrum]